jgi:adenosine kinase
MQFKGNFNENLTANKAEDKFNLALMPDTKTISFGGTSGNISYNLGQIGAQTRVITAVGKDFRDLGYETHIKTNSSVEFKGEVYPELFTASCYIVNDIKHHQVIIFHQGAMEKCPSISLKERKELMESIKIASVSPDNYGAMINWARELKEMKIPFIFDPGQVTPAFTKEILEEILPNAFCVIGNEFEMKMIQEKLQCELESLLKMNSKIIITKGEKGSTIYENGKKIEIPIVKPKGILDTTGAGDGYRAGLLYGLLKEMTLVDACKIGAVISSFVIETVGPQTQKYSMKNVQERYNANFEKKGL